MNNNLDIDSATFVPDFLHLYMQYNIPIITTHTTDIRIFIIVSLQNRLYYHKKTRLK